MSPPFFLFKNKACDSSHILDDKDKVHNTKIADKHWDLLPNVFHF